MKIIVAEDNDHKFERIREFLEQEIPESEITRFTHAKAVVIELKTLNDLNQNDYELLIQDMQMPLNRDESIDTIAGMYVLNQLERREIKINTIVCSADDVSFLNPFDYLNYPHFVKFEYSKSEWKTNLRNILKELK